MSNNKTTTKGTKKAPAQPEIKDIDVMYDVVTDEMFIQAEQNFVRKEAFTKADLEGIVETLKAMGNLDSTKGKLSVGDSDSWEGEARVSDYDIDERLAKLIQPIKVVGDTSKVYDRKDLKQHPTVNKSKVLNPSQFHRAQSKVVNGIKGGALRVSDVSNLMAPVAFGDSMEVVWDGKVYNSSYGTKLPPVCKIAGEWFDENVSSEGMKHLAQTFARKLVQEIRDSRPNKAGQTE